MSLLLFFIFSILASDSSSQQLIIVDSQLAESRTYPKIINNDSSVAIIGNDSMHNVVKEIQGTNEVSIISSEGTTGKDGITSRFFHLSDFDLISITASLIGALLTGFSAIFVFWLGIRSEKQKARNHLNGLKVYFVHSVKSTLDPIDKQIVQIIEFTQNISKDRFGEPSFQFVSSLKTSIEQVTHIDPKELLNIYLDNEPHAKVFQKLLNRIHLIKEINVTLKKHFYNFVRERRTYEENYQRYAFEIENAFKDEIQMNVQRYGIQKITNDEFLMGLNKIFIEWSRMKADDNEWKAREPSAVAKKLFDPLYDFIDENIQDPRSRKFESAISNARFALDNVDHLIEIYGKTFNSIADELSASKTEILSSVDSLGL